MFVCLSVCLSPLPVSLLSLCPSRFECVCVYENQYHAVHDTTIPNSRSPLLPAGLRVSFALLYKAMLSLSTWLRVLLATHQILKAKTAQDECRQSLDQNQRGFSTLQVKQGEMKRNEVERINLAEKIAEEFRLDKTLVVS